MGVSIIVAMSSNGVIGKDNDLPWKLPTDLKRFKEITSGNTILMGRKCYESIGRPLPNRTNIVLSRNTDLEIEGCLVRNNFESVIEEFKDEEIFVIGGSDIYEMAFPIANKLYLTNITDEIEGDVYLKGLNQSEWVLDSFEGHFKENGITYRFEDYVKP